MLITIIVSMALAAPAPPADDCPAQPEPAALASAGFSVPASGETLLFSAAPSSQSVRYALRVTRVAEQGAASATLVRLKRRFDCNVHDPAGAWTFTLAPEEAEAVFATAAALEQLGDRPSDIVLDGTTIELQRYSSGSARFSYSSNGRAKEQLARVVLDAVRRQVPANELPRSSDWRYRLKGTSF